MEVPLHSPDITEKEVDAVRSVLESGEVGGAGKYDAKCSSIMEEEFDTERVLMTTGCTHALEMAALLLDVDDGDEVILPSYTFPATATAFTLRGAEPVFAEIKPDTLNMDPEDVEEKVSEDTKAVVPVHYAGVGCKMDEITRMAEENGVHVVEDAAQGVNASFGGEQLGTMGDFGCYSFHATKSYVGGVGGALAVNDESYVERAEVVRQTGTDYEKFLRGEVDFYTWVDQGSSYAPSELLAALLSVQLERREEILEKRSENYERYYEELEDLEDDDILQLPHVPEGRETNFHIFYILASGRGERDDLVTFLNENGIGAASHYRPLHTSEMGRKFGYGEGDLEITERVADTIVRLPVFGDIKEKQQDHVIEKIHEYYE